MDAGDFGNSLKIQLFLVSRFGDGCSVGGRGTPRPKRRSGYRCVTPELVAQSGPFLRPQPRHPAPSPIIGGRSDPRAAF